VDHDADAAVPRLGGESNVLGYGHDCIVAAWQTPRVARLRSPSLDDVAAVLRVLHARDMADLGAPDFTLEDLLDQWGTSDFELRTDAVVAVDASDAIIGYAALLTFGALAVVDPAREREGIGSALLEWTERRARDGGLDVLRQWVAGENAGGHDLLTRAGYRQVRSYWRFARSLEPGLSEPSPPAGITLDSVDVLADAHALHEANANAFATNADYEPESFEAFRDRHLRAHDFDASLSRVARRGETIVGFVLCRRWASEGAGFVDLLGVDPRERGRGLGAMLLMCAFASFAAAGLREAQLGVASDNLGALALYERVGMAARQRADVLEKSV
jgi:mycothiol synthase